MIAVFTAVGVLIVAIPKTIQATAWFIRISKDSNPYRRIEVIGSHRRATREREQGIYDTDWMLDSVFNDCTYDDVGNQYLNFVGQEGVFFHRDLTPTIWRRWGLRHIRWVWWILFGK